MIPLPDAFLKAPLAHRGLHDIAQGRPENSRAAVQAALKHGYGIEIDVQRSADNAAMVFHDAGLGRLTDQSGPVRDRPLAALRDIPLTGGSEGIPELREILSIVAGRAPLLIEIKDQDGAMGPNIGPLETAVAGALAGYGGPVAVMSFNPHSVAAMGELAPDIPRGIVTSAYREKDWPELSAATCDHLRAIPDYDRVGASFISHEEDDLARPCVAELKARGANVLCWTIRNRARESIARRVAQNITFEGYLPDKAP